MAEESDSYPLHEAVFKNDIKKLSRLLRKLDVGEKDKHGNTALHLAVMLGRKECVQLLLARDAPVKVKNSAGWSVLAEAVSYGHRPTIASLVRKLRLQSRATMEARRPQLVRGLRAIQDFYMEVRWDFQSWLPLVSRVLPGDTCRLYKRGAALRLDTTLVDFSDMQWERGDVSFLFHAERAHPHSLTVMDNATQVYQRVRADDSELDIEDEVDLLMSSDILSAQVSTKGVSLSRAQSGWLFRADRSETVAGRYEAELYCVQGLVLESRKRREHLSSKDLRNNKALLETLTRGGASAVDQLEPTRRTSLEPPPDTSVTWDQYIQAGAGTPPRLGREPVYKESARSFKATVAMSSAFPLSLEALLDVLELTAPVKHLAKLRAFVTQRLPPGFPVQLEIPVLPTVTAKVTFQRFEFRDTLSPELFRVPAEYTEDPQRFPDL